MGYVHHPPAEFVDWSLTAARWFATRLCCGVLAVCSSSGNGRAIAVQESALLPVRERFESRRSAVECIMRRRVFQLTTLKTVTAPGNGLALQHCLVQGVAMRRSLPCPDVSEFEPPRVEVGLIARPHPPHPPRADRCCLTIAFDDHYAMTRPQAWRDSECRFICFCPHLFFVCQLGRRRDHRAVGDLKFRELGQHVSSPDSWDMSTTLRPSSWIGRSLLRVGSQRGCVAGFLLFVLLRVTAARSRFRKARSCPFVSGSNLDVPQSSASCADASSSSPR
mmetsp:Transcript_17600/g.54605  ORF Transcript_17600/g.54605 Transcript_17600/m.54605 type:complete len:278 (+) Transcript_17600:206-1039(+)